MRDVPPTRPDSGTWITGVSMGSASVSLITPLSGFKEALTLAPLGGGGGPKAPPRKRCLPCLHGRTASGSDSILTNLWIFQRFLRKCDISDIIFRFR